MRHWTIISIVLASAAAAARADVSVSLAPLAVQDETTYPYRSAEATIRNDSQSVIRAVGLRWRHGGPTMTYATAVAPGTECNLTVMLPAIRAAQTYEVRLLGAEAPDSPVVATTEAHISWEHELVTAEAFMDPAACEPWEYDLPRWPENLLRNIFLTAALSFIAAAASLFINRAGIRLVALVLVVGASAATFRILLGPQQVVICRSADAGSLIVLTTHRTAEWKSEDWGISPVYFANWQMAEDSTVIRPGRDVSVKLRPSDVRIFRRTGTKPPNRTAD